MELELLGAGGFGGSLTHFGVKKSILVHFWMIFWIYLGPLLGAFGNICIKELLNIYLSTFTFFICAKKRDFNTPPLVVSLCVVWMVSVMVCVVLCDGMGVGVAVVRLSD